MKKIIVFLCVCALVAGVMTCAGCSTPSDTESGTVSTQQNLNVKRVQAIYDIDIHNPAEMAGFADYVFVGYVERYIETEYNEAYPFPFTYYSVRVLGNIKGNLRAGESIEFMKHGGVEKDGHAIWLFEEDELPESGKLYVFLGVAARDHTTVRDCAPISNIPLEAALQEYGAAITAEQYASSSVVQTYRDAYANEVPYHENERFHSIYEEGYTAPEDASSGQDTPQIEWVKTTYDIDIYNPAAMVGFADYVFIGDVEETTNTEYRDADRFPYTHYNVRVLENIKGNLRTAEPVELVKSGGIKEDHSAIVLYDEDALPETGKLYVFLVAAQDDHSLLCSGANSSILLEEPIQNYGAAVTAEQLPESTVAQTYRDAYLNEVVDVRARSHSIYEEGYTAPEDGLESSDESSDDVTTASDDGSEPADDSVA